MELMKKRSANETTTDVVEKAVPSTPITQDEKPKSESTSAWGAIKVALRALLKYVPISILVRSPLCYFMGIPKALGKLLKGDPSGALKAYLHPIIKVIRDTADVVPIKKVCDKVLEGITLPIPGKKVTAKQATDLFNKALGVNKAVDLILKGVKKGSTALEKSTRDDKKAEPQKVRARAPKVKDGSRTHRFFKKGVEQNRKQAEQVNNNDNANKPGEKSLAPQLR